MSPSLMAARTRLGFVLSQAGACRNVCFSALFLLALPSAVQAQFSYTVNNGAITITGYTGSGGSAAIPDTINDLPVTRIGDYAFGSSSLTDLTIPGSVTNIGNYAFISSSLTRITIPGSVTGIGDYAFNGCLRLTSLTIPDSVTGIGAWAFYDCTGLTNLTVGAGVTRMGIYAFSSCTGLKGVTLSDGLTCIGDHAFESCGRLTDVAIPGSVPGIGVWAFYNCISLTNVMIGAGVTNIGASAFEACSSLTGATIPDSVTDVGASAFYNCAKLSGVRLGDNVARIGDYAFAVCLSLAGVTIPNHAVSIGAWAFYDCSSLTCVMLGTNVTSIGNYAFASCIGLTRVTIPGSVASIGEYAFNTCTSLTNLTLCSGVSNIRNYAFSSCLALKDVAIPDSVTGIGEGAFESCLSLTGATISNGVTGLGAWAFYGCASLASVTIGTNVTSIGKNAFAACYNLTEVTIPGRVTSVGAAAFANCSKLTVLLFLGNAPSLGSSALQGDVSLTVYHLLGAQYWPMVPRTWGGRPTALWFFSNQPPVITRRAPSGDPAPIVEGAAVAFSVTASDSTDPNTARRAMSNITWYVDGVLQKDDRTGAPSAIASPFTLKTDTNTVQGAAFRIITVKAVALDRQGGAAETAWVVRVNNLQAAQSITFPALPEKALDDPDFAAGATVTSGLQIQYTSSNESVAQVVGGVIHVVGTGTAVLTASQPGNIDVKAAAPVKQTLTVKARLTATVPGGGGTVAGVGLYAPGARVALTAKPSVNNTFLRWEDGSQSASRSLVMPNANTAVSAWFGITTNVPKPEIADPGPQRATVGVAFTLALDIASDSLPAVSVTGLPAGLGYNAATKTIAGVPTASVTATTITVTAKNVNKSHAVQAFMMAVDPLPAWAQGSFSGVAGIGALGSGSASMSVTALGAASGRLTLRGTNFIFNSRAYASHSCDSVFTLVTTATVGKVSWPLTLTVGLSTVMDPAGVVPPTLSEADGALPVDGQMTLYRNIWKDQGMAAVLTNTFTGYFTATLPGGSEYGSGYLTFTVDKLGGVKTTGKLADGTAVSLSGALILDEAGRAFTVLYTAPATYMGGGLFGVAEFFKPDAGAKVVVRLLDGAPFVWESLNPAATQAYGVGFSRELGLAGGWYDTLGNLSAYYANRTLSIGTEGASVPELLVGTNRYASVWWDPDGIVLAVATNRSGFMTGIAAPKAGAPVKSGGGNAYDYASATNAAGLAIALTRATGVFTGSFKTWFDYGTTHTYKTVTYEGALTPVCGNPDDGVAGRGFFLWPDTADYLNAQRRPVPYGFNWSYDLKIRQSEPVP